MDFPCAQHSGVCVNVEALKKDTMENAKEIKTVSDAVIKLTMIVEQMQKEKETIPEPRPFWDAETKKVAIKYAFVLGLILVFGLLGANIINNISLDAVKGVVGQ